LFRRSTETVLSLPVLRLFKEDFASSVAFVFFFFPTFTGRVLPVFLAGAETAAFLTRVLDLAVAPQEKVPETEKAKRKTKRRKF
jgi:hypothetical protein